ncbi:MAG: serine hydrolase [Thermoanaerobaculia bacterium]
MALRCKTAGAAALLALVLGSGCATGGAARSVSSIEAAVERAAQRCGCRMGIAARHLESGRSYEHNADDEFESASVIKVAILTQAMAEVRENRVDLADRWTLTAQTKTSETGVLSLLDSGLQPTWNDLLTLMIGESDNTAANAWIERLGIENINARMASLGFPNTQLFSLLPWRDSNREGPRWSGFRFGQVTPRDVGDWMARVAEGELLDAESSRRIFEYLDKDASRLRIARRFPPEFLWAGKTGSMRGVRNDTGILRTKKGRFVLVVLTDGSQAESANPADHPSVLAIADVARTIVDVWSRDLPDLTDRPK